MASSNNLASLEAWSFRSASFPDSWISDAFARETETFTKALQQSLSSSNTVTVNPNQNNNNNNNNNNNTGFEMKQEQKPTGSVSDPDIYPKRRNTVANGKISKRKSRASKRSPTTFIAADPSNFRQMVQQVTGIQFGDPHMPVTSVLKPEPQRPGNNRVIQSYSLPTLDTSAYLLDNNGNGLGRVDRMAVGPTRQEENPPVVVAEGGGGGTGFDFGSFQNFPTLESWRVM